MNITTVSVVSLLLTTFFHATAADNVKSAEQDTAEPPAGATPCKTAHAKDCEQAIERITVKGRYSNPISLNSQGVYTLNEQLIRDYRFGNGNLNDILAILPGVQFSEQHFAADQISNIKPGEISIAGAEGYQTGYFINGINNNSRLSTGNAIQDRNLLQDVSGHSQEMFLNTQLLDYVEVYDSNIPVEFGQFSGGVVKAQTRDAGTKPSWGLSYRTTKDGFIRFNDFYGPDFNGQDTLDTPSFKKHDVNLHFTTPVGQHGGLLTQFQTLRSSETKLQLGKLRPQTQHNHNILAKYHHRLDQHYLALTAFYAPYTGNYFDTYALNSDYRIKGGGTSLQTEWRYQAQWAEIETLASWRDSKNSKEAAPFWFSWRNATGKKWGDYNGSFSSNEGGFGSIDKTQQSYSIKQNYLFNTTHWLGATANSKLGGELSKQDTAFDRLTDAVLYNGAVLNPNIHCSGFTIDCISTQFKRPLAELEAELGRPLDFRRVEDIFLYQNNIQQTGQYFQTRQVSPQGKASAAITALSLYGEQQLAWRKLELVAGLRYDYNDFFKQHNAAPRLRGSYDLFANNKTMLVAGINRYYEADLLQYKLNEAMQPHHTQIRRVSRNQLLDWEASLLNRGYRSEYRDTRTPYSDELSVAVRQQLLGGTLEAKWLRRDNQQLISRQKGYNDAGEAIMYGINAGSSTYERYSLSWMARFAQQHIELNLSFASNTADRKSFDGSTTYRDGNGDSRLNFNYDDSELVFLQQLIPSTNNPNKLEAVNSLITRNDLLLEKQDFNRPIIANLGWGGQFNRWHLSLHARYTSSQEAMFATGQMLSVKEGSSLCMGCVPNQREYPVYRKEDRPAYWLLNASLRYELPLTAEHLLTFSLDAENILNGRTHQISQFATGTELGRRFWLGVAYNY